MQRLMSNGKRLDKGPGRSKTGNIRDKESGEESCV